MRESPTPTGIHNVPLCTIAAAGVDDPGNVAGRASRPRAVSSGVLVRATTRDGVVEIEQQRAEGIGAERSDAVGQHEPAVRRLDRRTAVAELDDLPHLGGAVNDAAGRPRSRRPPNSRARCSRRRVRLSARCLPPTSRGKSAMPLLSGAAAGEAVDGEAHQIVRCDQPRGDVEPVVSRVGRAVLGAPVGMCEQDEACILDAVALLGDDRHHHPPAERRIGREVGSVRGCGDFAHRLHRLMAVGARRQLYGQRPAGSLSSSEHREALRKARRAPRW